MSRLSKILNKTYSTMDKGQDVVQYPMKKIAQGAVAGGAYLGKKSVKKVDSQFSNAYTGLKPSKGFTAAFAGAAGLYGAASYGMKTEFAPRVGEISYTGEAPIMNADGVASKTNAPTLGANGSMVFGLHNARKG